MPTKTGPDRRRSPRPTAFLEGGGELGRLMRACDWSTTPLGPPERWPQSLKSAVSILLPSRAQIVLFWGPEFITLYNDAYRPVFGAKHPRALGQPAHEAWSEIWHEGLKDLFTGVVGTGEAFWAKDRLFILERHGYPEETYFDVSYDPVRDESGDVGGLFCIVSETTGRVVGERRILTLRDLAARHAVAQSPTEACTLSLESFSSNQHDIPFALLYLSSGDGVPPSLVCGSPGTADLSDPARWPWADVLAGGEMRVVQLDNGFGTPPAGAWSRPPDEAVVIPIADASQSGNAGMLVVGLNPFQSFSEDYRGFLELVARQLGAGIASATAYEAERARAEALTELDRAKTAFFSNVSHEFRTPLTLMLGPLEDTLAQSDALSIPDRERLEAAHRNAMRLLKLVNTLLDFSRLEAGRLDASYEATDLAGYTAELTSVFRAAIERAGLTLTVECPPLGEPVYVDREMWEQVVFNLLSNAFKFTFEGGIEVGVARDGDRASLTVKDTGTGIAAHELPHLFERFHRVKGARGRTFEGTGIGLALVQELTRLHGGTIDVESRPDHGSRFTVSIPLGYAHLPHDRIGATRRRDSAPLTSDVRVQELLSWLPAVAAPVALDAPPAVRHPTRVLLVDDNADMREYLQRLLADSYTVEAVGDGLSALAAARERPPDLILTDVMIPELDGFGLLKAVRADPGLRSTPVIMLSARAGVEARVEGLESGADDYLVKPFSARELLARVASRIELSRLQAQVERDRAEMAELFAQTPVPTAVMRGPDLIFEIANPAYAEVSGARELVGRPLLEAIPELRGQEFDARLRRVMATGEPFAGREALLRLKRNGRMEDTYWSFVYAPLRGPDGSTDRVIAICNEVTTEVRAREIIRESEARYRAIFESAGASIWEEDFTAVAAALEELRRNGVRDFPGYFAEHPEFVRHAIGLVRIVDVNDTTLRLFKAKSKSELLESLHRIFLPETEAVFIKELTALLEGRPSVEAETCLCTLDGERLDVFFTIAFPPLDGSLRNALVTIMDISARKRAERAMFELHEQRLNLIQRLRETDRHKDEFLATLAHELRNPLAPLRNSLHLLRLGETGDSASDHIHGMMERQVSHMVRLVDDLMEMSRISRGTFDLRRERVELAAVVRNAVETSDPLIQSAGHRLELSFPEEPLWVDGDPVRLAQVIANLLNNSAKYTDPGGEISVRVIRDGDTAVVTVRDTGCGISAKALPRVFEMFSRDVNASGRDQGGLGIGLALARRLVEMHDGTISAASGGPGAGSEFTVRVPLAGKYDSPAESARAVVTTTLPQKRILVVDDNRDSAQSMSMLLEFLGASVQVAFDGDSALAAYEAYNPAVILLDIGMPGMDGYEVARRIRSEYPERHTAIVALTGWGQEEDRRRARQAGFDHHLIKPADIGALQVLLESLTPV